MTSIRIVKIPRQDLGPIDLDGEVVDLIDETLYRLKVGSAPDNQTILHDFKKVLSDFAQKHGLDWDPHNGARLPVYHHQAKTLEHKLLLAERELAYYQHTRTSGDDDLIRARNRVEGLQDCIHGLHIHRMLDSEHDLCIYCGRERNDLL